MSGPELPERLAGAALTLSAPPRVSTSYSILLAVDALARDDRPSKPTHLVLAAALGACWHRVRSRIRFEGDVLAYGLQVVDLLLGPEVKLAPGDRPATLLDLVRAGQVALELIRDAVPTQEDVHGAQVFSPAPSGASSASASRSSDDGGSGPGGSPH